MSSVRSIEILYGTSFVTAHVPERNLKSVLVSKEAQAGDPAKIIRDALASPIGSPSLNELGRNARDIVIIADDITRSMPSSLTIREMISALRATGDKRITILIATGLHRPMTKQEITERFGELSAKYNIVNHDAKDVKALADFGLLSSGNRLYLNKLAARCDLLIAEGFIEPHFFAGFSGGRKSILPGIAGESTIMNNHCPRNILDANSRMGSMERNPVNIECEEACEKSGLKFILNIALNRDKRVTAAFAGDPFLAHRKGCEYVRDHAAIKAAPADIVITSNSGYPLDLNLYQAVKGMAAAAKAVKKGGVIIIAAECPEGVGHGPFCDFITSCASSEELFKRSNEETPVRDKWQVQHYARAVKDHTVILVSRGLSKDRAKSLFLRGASGMDEALGLAFEIAGADATVNVIPEGPMVMPVTA